MGPLVGAILVGFVSLTALVGGQARAPNTEQTLAELQQILARAWVAGDRATIERIIAPEWTSTGPDGTVTTRGQVLADVFERRVHRIQQVEIDNVRVLMISEASIALKRRSQS